MLVPRPSPDPPAPKENRTITKAPLFEPFLDRSIETRIEQLGVIGMFFAIGEEENDVIASILSHLPKSDAIDEERTATGYLDVRARDCRGSGDGNFSPGIRPLKRWDSGRHWQTAGGQMRCLCAFSS